MKQKIYLNLLFIVTLLYGIFTLLGVKFSEKGEFYPFFSWTLFKSVPQDIKQYHINVFQNNTKISFFEIKENELSFNQTKYLLVKLNDCIHNECFEESFSNIAKRLPEKSCAIFFSIDEAKKVDTLGFINNNKFSSKNCLQ